MVPSVKRLRGTYPTQGDRRAGPPTPSPVWPPTDYCRVVSPALSRSRKGQTVHLMPAARCLRHCRPRPRADGLRIRRVVRLRSRRCARVVAEHGPRDDEARCDAQGTASGQAPQTAPTDPESVPGASPRERCSRAFLRRRRWGWRWRCHGTHRDRPRRPRRRGGQRPGVRRPDRGDAAARRQPLPARGHLGRRAAVAVDRGHHHERGHLLRPRRRRPGRLRGVGDPERQRLVQQLPHPEGWQVRLPQRCRRLGVGQCADARLPRLPPGGRPRVPLDRGVGARLVRPGGGRGHRKDYASDQGAVRFPG